MLDKIFQEQARDDFVREVASRLSRREGGPFTIGDNDILSQSTSVRKQLSVLQTLQTRVLSTCHAAKGAGKPDGRCYFSFSQKQFY